jgi:hypothetical protein
MAGETNDEGVDGVAVAWSTTGALVVLLGLADVERELLREPSTLRQGVTGREETGVVGAVGVCERDDLPVATGTG